MDNLARILTVAVTPGFIQPCVRVHRGIDTAARETAAAFKLEMTFSYLSGGRLVAPVTSTQLITETAFIAQLDARWVRCHARAIAAAAAPDPGSSITATVMMTISDAAGARIECCDAEVSIIPVR
jgi:hypothetical protein